jgi:hypothetical protein
MLASDLQPETFYAESFDVLTRIARTEFHLSDDEAAAVVHDILIAVLGQLPRITDMHSWLRGALTAAIEKRAHA